MLSGIKMSKKRTEKLCGQCLQSREGDQQVKMPLLGKHLSYWAGKGAFQSRKGSRGWLFLTEEKITYKIARSKTDKLIGEPQKSLFRKLNWEPSGMNSEWNWTWRWGPETYTNIRKLGFALRVLLSHLCTWSFILERANCRLRGGIEIVQRQSSVVLCGDPHLKEDHLTLPSNIGK